MTSEELASRLNGRGYGDEITKDEERMAKEAGLVVVFGYSDDGIEFRGAISDEDGAPGKTAITRDGLLQNKCGDEDCPYFAKLVKASPRIEALWCEEKDGPTWTYKTDIPHVTFDIQSDDAEEGIYCRGMVFRLEDVPQ